MIVTAEERARLIGRLRALMSRTVANGCTEEEELAAARQVAKTIDQLGEDPNALSLAPQADHMRAERQSRDYQQLLERTTLEGLFKSAIQELALNHINTVAPPRRRPAPGTRVEWLRVPQMLQAHLAMVLAIGDSRMAHEILAASLEELVQDGMLPDRLAVPIGE